MFNRGETAHSAANSRVENDRLKIFTLSLSLFVSSYSLKAIGYRDRFVRRVVLREALYLSLLGHVPGLAISYLLYLLLAGATGLPIEMPLSRVALMLALTVAMCMVAGVIAIRKVIAADPAEVFA